MRRKHPVEVADVKFLRANTDRMIKMTVPGPFTMSQQAQNDFYRDEKEMVLDYAAAVNAEIKDLFAAGANSRHRDFGAPRSRRPANCGRTRRELPCSSFR